MVLRAIILSSSYKVIFKAALIELKVSNNVVTGLLREMMLHAHQSVNKAE